MRDQRPWIRSDLRSIDARAALMVYARLRVGELAQVIQGLKDDELAELEPGWLADLGAAGDAFALEERQARLRE